MDYFFYKTEGNSFNNSYIIKVLFVEFVRTAITALLICSWWECKTQLNLSCVLHSHQLQISSAVSKLHYRKYWKDI